MIARGRTLSAARTKALIKEVAWVRDAAFSRSMGVGCDVYVLANGGALIVFEDGRSAHYDSYEELVRVHESARAKVAQSPKSVAGDLIVDGEAFVSNVPKLLEALPAALRVDAKRLDFSQQSLGVVDSAIKKIGAKRVLTSAVFAPLVAYIGEVMRRALKGRWEMRLDVDGTWVPWVVDRQGRARTPIRFYKELMEYGRSASTRAYVSGMVGGARLLSRGTSKSR